MTGENYKKEVLTHLAAGKQIVPLPKAKVKIGSVVIHQRFRSEPKGGGKVWSFNINPNTLSADFELWICGSSSTYYLIPAVEFKTIYEDKAAYVDYAHAEIRVVDINSGTHQCSYGRGRSINFASYFNAALH